MRNPLAPIQYVAQLLGRSGGADVLKSDRAPIDMMKRQVGHLVRLVDDLLDISRINSGKIELRKERAEVASIVADALGMSRTHIEAKGHRVEHRVAAEPLVVCGDPVRLTQVVTNLVKNAAKYTPPGGLIEIGTAREGDEAVVRVRDNGVGIGPDMLPRVFDLFTQADDRGQTARAGSASASRLRRSWSICTAAGSRRAATGSARAASSSCACRSMRPSPLNAAAEAAGASARRARCGHW